MRIFFLLTFYLFFCSNFFAQIQFNEEALLLGCSNSSYGLGTFGGGISLSRETPLLMGKRKSNHVILFQPSFYEYINDIQIKEIFENWLKKNDKPKILINF